MSVSRGSSLPVGVEYWRVNGIGNCTKSTDGHFGINVENNNNNNNNNNNK